MTGAVAALMGISSVTISVSPSSATGTASGTNVVTSNAVTATVIGGSATSGEWVRVSGSTDISATIPSGPTTEFVTVMPSPDIRTASFVYEAVVNGVTYQSPEVSVTLERF